MQTTFPSPKCFQLSFRSSVEDPVRRPAQIWRWVIFTRKCIHTCNLCIQSQTLIIRQRMFKQFLSFFFLLFVQNLHHPLNHCNNTDQLSTCPVQRHGLSPGCGIYKAGQWGLGWGHQDRWVNLWVGKLLSIMTNLMQCNVNLVNLLTYLPTKDGRRRSTTRRPGTLWRAAKTRRDGKFIGAVGDTPMMAAWYQDRESY